MKKDIIQYAIDVEDTEDDMENKIMDALDKAGINVIGIDWRARWKGENYSNGKPPISSY